MIKSIFIMKENGELLFMKNFMEEKYDNDILIGFFTSISNFSREALRSVVKYVDLGEENKLILHPVPEEELITAAIVSSRDDNSLIMKVLTDITQDFIMQYSPFYEPEKIYQDEMEGILKENLGNKVIRSPVLRTFIAWVILLPLSLLLTFLSTVLTSSFLSLLELVQLFIELENVTDTSLTSIYFTSSFVILIVYTGPNLISGYLTVNRNVAFVNSIIYIVITVIMYYLFHDPLYFNTVIANIPIIGIASVFFSYIGVRISTKRNIRSK